MRPLRSVPASRALSISSRQSMPGGGSSSGYQARPGEVSPKETVPGNKYDVDEAAIDALGVKLIAGRPFEPQEILPPSETFEDAPQAILAAHFFEQEAQGFAG